jgi:hypothetical protein
MLKEILDLKKAQAIVATIGSRASKMNPAAIQRIAGIQPEKLNELRVELIFTIDATLNEPRVSGHVSGKGPKPTYKEAL